MVTGRANLWFRGANLETRTVILFFKHLTHYKSLGLNLHARQLTARLSLKQGWHTNRFQLTC